METVVNPVIYFALADCIPRVAGDVVVTACLGKPSDGSLGARIVHQCPTRVRNAARLTGPLEKSSTLFLTHLVDLASIGAFHLAGGPFPISVLIGTMHCSAGRLLDHSHDRPVGPTASKLTENRVMVLTGMVTGGAVTLMASNFAPMPVASMVGVLATKVTTMALGYLRLYIS